MSMIIVLILSRPDFSLLQVSKIVKKSFIYRVYTFKSAKN